jgi:hypothetical protein
MDDEGRNGKKAKPSLSLAKGDRMVEGWKNHSIGAGGKNKKLKAEPSHPD